MASSMPRPERRTGTRDMVFGEIVVVVYSYPRAVLAAGPFTAERPAAVASQPMIREIS